MLNKNYKLMLTTKPSQNVQHSQNEVSNFTLVQTTTTSFNQGQSDVQPPSYEQAMNIGNNLHSNNTSFPQPVVMQNTSVIPTHVRNRHNCYAFSCITFIVIIVVVIIIIIIAIGENKDPKPLFDTDDFDSNFTQN